MKAAEFVFDEERSDDKVKRYRAPSFGAGAASLVDYGKPGQLRWQLCLDVPYFYAETPGPLREIAPAVALLYADAHAQGEAMLAADYMPRTRIDDIAREAESLSLRELQDLRGRLADMADGRKS